MAAGSRTIAGSEVILQADAASANDELAAYCPDLDRWPTSWMYEEGDLSPGWQIVECFKSFFAPSAEP
jgi:hypothetical protein